VNLTFNRDGWDDYVYWVNTDQAVTRRLSRLLEETLLAPFEGLGKPEKLRHQLVGCWSRRLTEEHRLVYRVTADAVGVLMARYHY
jgi:toxin YoeB